MRGLTDKDLSRNARSGRVDPGEASREEAGQVPRTRSLASRLIDGIYEKVDFRSLEEDTEQAFLRLVFEETRARGASIYHLEKDRWVLSQQIGAGGEPGKGCWSVRGERGLLLKIDDPAGEMAELMDAVLRLYADLVERKQIYQDIFQSELRLRSMQENIPVGIYRSDPQGNLISCNPALFRMLGYSNEQELMDLNTGVHYVDRSDRDRLVERLEREGAVRDMEFQLRRKDGLIFWASTTARAYRGSAGELAFHDGSIMDITQRKIHEEEQARSYEVLSQAMEGTVEAILRISEVRDPYTAGHQQRVACLARAIAEELGMEDGRVQGVYVAGVLHDIGKIYVPAEILSKPGKISDLEYTVLKTHAEIGHDILSSVRFPWPIAEMVYQHHERLDGTGYPRGLSGADICLEARILAVADVVEAMVSHRPYRPAHSLDKALDEIFKGRGHVYDASVVDACQRLFDEESFDFESVDPDRRVGLFGGA